LVVFIEHDVEAEFIGQQPLVVITMEQIGGDRRVAFVVGKIDPQ